jgi:hypothetical protein
VLIVGMCWIDLGVKRRFEKPLGDRGIDMSTSNHFSIKDVDR